MGDNSKHKTPNSKKEKDYSRLFDGAPPAFSFMQLCERVAKEAKSRSGVLDVLLIIFRCAFLRYSIRFSLIIFAGLVCGAITSFTPHIMGYIMDNLLTQNTDAIYFWIGLLIGLGILQNLLNNWMNYTIFFIATQVEDTWRYLGLKKYYSLPLSWHDVHDSGKTTSKIMRAAGNIWFIVCWLLGRQIFSSGFSLIIVLCSALYSTPQLWWLWLCPPIFFFYANKTVSEKIEMIQRGGRKCEEDANKILYDASGNVRCVKAFDRGDEEARQYALRWGGYHLNEYKEETISKTKTFTLDSVETLMRGVLIAYCWHSGVSVSEMTVLLAYLQLIISPIAEIDSSYTETRRTALKVTPLFDLICKVDSLEDAKDAVDIEPLRNEISVENVSYMYNADEDDFLDKANSDDEAEGDDEDDEDDEDEDGTKKKAKGKSGIALSGVSLTLRAGTTTAFVGRSGAGKSTLVMLLLRFYDPTSGTLKWDSTDLRSSSRASLRKRMAWVPQDTSLFSRTIAENIAYGYPDATRVQIIEAAKRANAHEFILETRDGYDSVVGERGVQLSGGQRQRIAIARALLADPSVLILDECTSQLDSESEKAIQEAIKGLKESHMTQVVIAHRLSTVLHADQIVVMDKGEIVAIGKHAELLVECPLYNKFYSLQFRDMDEEKEEDVPVTA